MKILFFCYNPYSYAILQPISEVAKKKGYDILWYVRPSIKDSFPYKDSVNWTTLINKCFTYKPDAIFVPGNEVPYYLSGVKVQVFHGLAGEKKGHFRIRHYFDLYLTQGPYFTRFFKKASEKYKNFNVVETGWPKLDSLYEDIEEYNNLKKEILTTQKSDKIILYAPTFSPSLTSAPKIIDKIEETSFNTDYSILIKFHDLMNPEIINEYENRFSTNKKVKIIKDDNILKYLIISDLMISDTSSVVYEFLLLDKPVVTYKSISQNINWDNITDKNRLISSITTNLEKDLFKDKRANIIKEYHPYNDGKSAERMLDAVEKYITNNGIPQERKLGYFRRRKINRMFGKI